MNRSFDNRSFGHQRRSNYNHNYNQNQSQCSPQNDNFIPLESSSPVGFQNRRFSYQNKWRNSAGYDDFGARGRQFNYQHSPHSPYRINKSNHGNRMSGSSPNNSFQRNYRNNQHKRNVDISNYFNPKFIFEDPWEKLVQDHQALKGKGQDMSSNNEVISSQETSRNSVVDDATDLNCSATMDASSSVVSEDVILQES